MVGAISVGFISQIYCLMRLLLPTPDQEKNKNNFALHSYRSSHFVYYTLKKTHKIFTESETSEERFGQGLFIDQDVYKQH